MHRSQTTSSPRLPILALALGLGWFAWAPAHATTAETGSMPWKEAGHTAESAAAHLLDRFTFGPRPGEVEAVVRMGLDAWLEAQLASDLPEPTLEEALRPFESLELSNEEIVARYPSPGQVLREAQREGKMSREEMAEMIENRDSTMESRERGEMRRELFSFAREKGYRSQRRLTGELMGQKLYRALYAENQLNEVLTAFWLNHFYVSLVDTQARPFVMTYERDAIRPFALGSFGEMLAATARHPAMLIYLDNVNSTADETRRTTLEYVTGRRQSELAQRRGRRGRLGPQRRIDNDRPERRRGLNENYARELLELHTLGVDGGYTQEDVVEVARAFTGWAALPPGASREEANRRIERARRATDLGFVVDGDFLFRANMHDAEKKKVLGQTLPAGRGIQDGLDVLEIVASHPSTARHIAHKLAVRFVSDEPPRALVDRLAATFTQSRGDIRSMVRALVASPEFWADETRGAKIKSPFELAASSLRALGARMSHPQATVQWISRMGQELYAYKAPTGYPDSATTWVNTGSLLNRMNFGLELAAGWVDGVTFDLAELNQGREPESRRAALEQYLGLLLPERDHATTLAQLTPVVEDPELSRKVAERAGGGEPEEPERESLQFYGRVEFSGSIEAMEAEGHLSRPRWRSRKAARREPATPLEQVVGVILGSPEFQRR